MFAEVADHNCGYDMSIYKDSGDQEWHINLTDKKDNPTRDQIINYCPMCGKRLNERYYDI